MKYETVQYIYQKDDFLYTTSKEVWNRYFELIRGFPLFEKQKDSISRANSVGIATGERISKKELDSYIEQLNCTQEQAFEEYRNLIRDIKSEKEIYLKCIDAELAKGDSSEYAEKPILGLYSFHIPWSSLISPPGVIRKLNFLKVFKEFVLNDNEEVLPVDWKAAVYLKCNCKIY
jgi:hypothetical protein